MGIKIDNGNSAGRQVAEMNDTPVSLTSSSIETNLFTAVIRGGEMGLTKQARFAIKTAITTSISLNPTLTLKVKYGSSSFTIVSAATLVTSLTSSIIDIEGDIVNMGVSNSQLLTVTVMQAGSAVPLVSLGSSARLRTTWTEDSTVDCTFAITAQFSSATSNATLQYNHGFIALS